LRAQSVRGASFEHRSQGREAIVLGGYMYSPEDQTEILLFAVPPSGTKA
jgi:hypothetical protein